MDTYRKQAGILRVMAHPVRLRMLDILRSDSECVCHLSAVLGKSQPYVSQQLAILRKAGLVIDEKEGTNAFYRLADDSVWRQVTAILGSRSSGKPDNGNSSALRALAGNGRGERECRHVVKDCACPKCRQSDPCADC